MTSQSKATFRGRATEALTLLELLTVLVISGVLMTMLIKMLEQPRASVERVACMSNMRSLHVALNSYIIDHKHWPQMPPGLDNEQSAEWWIKSLASYVGEEKVWSCPTFRRKFKEEPQKYSKDFRIDYIPTDFDALPMTPFKWSSMPWLVEVGDFHGAGNLAVFPDGSVKTIWDMYREMHPGAPLP